MNIANFAASRGKSKQRVYQMIKEAGLKVSDLTDGQGQITESGLEKLNEIVPDRITVPEGETPAEKKPSSGSQQEEKQQKRESEIERLTRQNEILLENVNNLSATIKGLQDQLSEAHKIADQAQQLHAIDKQRILDLTKRLEAGSPEGESEKPIPAESPETIESDTVKTDPEGESPAEKKQDPEKAEGETAPAAESSESSPVTTDQKQEQKPEQKPEEKTKATLKQRLRFLFTGER